MRGFVSKFPPKAHEDKRGEKLAGLLIEIFVESACREPIYLRMLGRSPFRSVVAIGKLSATDPRPGCQLVFSV